MKLLKFYRIKPIRLKGNSVCNQTAILTDCSMLDYCREGLNDSVDWLRRMSSVEGSSNWSALPLEIVSGRGSDAVYISIKHVISVYISAVTRTCLEMLVLPEKWFRLYRQ